MALSSRTRDGLVRAYGAAYAAAAEETVRGLSGLNAGVGRLFDSSVVAYESGTATGDRKVGLGGRKVVHTRWDTEGPPKTDTGKESGPGTDTSADKDTSDDDNSGSDTSGGEPNVDTGVWEPPDDL